MTPNSLCQRVYTGRAMRAKTEVEMREVIRVAMLCGMEQGYGVKSQEVKEALEVLGFKELAFKDQHEF